MPQTFDYMGALREGYTPKEIKRFVKGLDQQNDLEQRGTKFVQKQAKQREAVNSMVRASRSPASSGLTPAETLYPAGVTRDPIGQDIQNTAAAPNVPRPTGIVRAENVAPDLVLAFELAPESALGDATSGYLSEAPDVKLRGARGVVQGIKDAPKAAWLGLNQAASAGMQAIGDVVQEDIGILTKAAKATSDLLTLNMSPTEIPADTGSNVIQRVGRDAYAAHTQGMQELSDKYAPDSWGGAVMNAGAQAGQQLGILGTAAAIGIRNPAAMTNFSLGALGAQSGLTEYGDARTKGFDVPRSLLKAGVGGGMEVVTEVAPMGKLVNFMSTPAKKGVAAFLKDAAEYGLQDIGGELLNTMITDVVNGKMQARPNMTPQEQADEVSRYFSSGEWKQAAADTFKQAVLQGGIMMGAAKGVQHLDAKIKGEQDPLTDGVAFQQQNLPPVNPERQGRVDKLAGIMANESERTAQMRLNIANQRRDQQPVTAPPAQQVEQVAPEVVQPVAPPIESSQQQEIPAQIAPTAEAPETPVAAPVPAAASAPAQDAEDIAPELADLLRRKTNLEKAIFAADGTEKKTATKRMKDNYAALTATITALQPQNPEQEVSANGQQAEPETAAGQGAVATDTAGGAGGAGGTAPADEAGMGSAEAMPGGAVSGVDEQPGDRVPLLRPQPDVAATPRSSAGPSPDIMALVDGKTDDQIQKTIDMVRGLNPERAAQIEAYWKSKATPVPESQTGQEPAPAAQDGRESVPPAGDATQKGAAVDSQQRETAEVAPIPAGRKEHIEKMIERHGGLDKIPPAWREQWDRINAQEAEQQGDTAQEQPWDAAAFMAEMEKEQARSDAAHERAYQLETPEVKDAQAKYENGTIDIDEFEKQLDQATASSAPSAISGPKPQPGKIGSKLAHGDVVLTATGRQTSPFPKVDTSTNGKAGNTFKRVDQWLMDNAIEEARSRGDEFNLRQFEANRDKPAQADKDSAEMYLFGEEQPPVPKPFLKPLVTPSEDQGKAAPTSGPSATAEKKVAQETAPDDLKGFNYKPGDGDDFSITKGNLTVKATSQGNGKYQASWGSATSSPYLDKQTVVDWADNIVKESQRTDKGRGQAGSATQPPPLSPIAAHDDFIKRLDEGSATPDELKASFDSLQENRDAIKAELGKLKKDDLLKRLGRMEAYRYKNDKKETVVNAVFRRMLSSHNLSGTIQYNPMEKGAMDAALKAKVDATTERDIVDHAEQVKAAREDAKKRMEGLVKSAKNPETWEEFQNFIRMHKDKGGINALTPEQRKRYDELHAEHNKETAAKQVERKATVREAGEQVDSEIIETAHTKTKEPLFVVKAADRVDKDVYREWNATAKKLGGWYSSYRAGGAVPGFQFKTRESAESFKQYLKGDAGAASETIKERIEEHQESKKRSAADKLTALADSMEEKANGVLNADRLTNTAKRAQQAESTDAAARKTIALATTIRNIARAIQEGEAKHLEGISAGTHVETLDSVLSAAKYANLRENGPSGWSVSDERYRMPNESDMDYVDYPYPNPHQDHIKEIGLVLREKSGAVKDGEWLMKRYAVTSGNDSSVITFTSPSDIERLESVLAKAKKVPRLKSAVENVTERMAKYKRLQKMNIPDEPTLRAALREYLQFKDEGPKADKAKQLERQLAGNKNVGIDFFPTPPAVAADLVERAGIEPGMKVLEPSGGTGNIAEEIRKAGGDVDVAEISEQMRDLLDAKGFNLVAHDFMDLDEGGYDAVVMNPPFSADIDHVRHAFDLLKPGGRLVSIVGEGSFGNQKKHTEFQEWLDEHGATVEKLPQGTFTDRTQLKTTGANARVVEMVKPGEVKDGYRPTVSRLTQAGKRGSAQAYTVHLSPSQAMSLKEIRQEVSDGEAGGRAGIYNESTPGTTQVSWGSSFPEYFQNRGLTKKQVLPILDRIIQGEPVTEAQWLIAEDMLKAKRYDTLNRILNERAEKQAESHVGMSQEELDAAKEDALDFFSQFGDDNETSEETTGSVRTDEREGAAKGDTSPVDTDRGPAPAADTIDGSGWGQQVAAELSGDKKALRFGDKERAGRNVGLSEFMDEFTPDPQGGLSFSPGEQQGNQRATLSQKEIDKVVDLISRALPADKVTLKIVDDITLPSDAKAAYAAHGVDKGAVAGMHQSVTSIRAGEVRSIITLAMDGATDRTGYHEVMHAAESLGVISTADLKTLERVYPSKGGVDSSERRADAFAEYVASKEKSPGITSRIFGRIRAFLNRLGLALRGNGWRMADDVFSDLLGGKLARDGNGVPRPNAGTQFMTAWHGSPHDHDKFSMDKIGTGEGAQVYGWGLYFAGRRQVAEYYRETLANRDPQGYKNAHLNAKSLVERFSGDAEYAAEVVREQLATTDQNSANYLRLSDTLKMIENGAYKGELPKQGRLYEVELAPNEDELLDWDKPLSEQSAKVKGIIFGDNDLGNYIRRVTEVMERNGEYEFFPTGVTAYMGFAEHIGSQKAASEYLHSLGIRGIKYLDGSSRRISTEQMANGKWRFTSSTIGYDTKELAEKAADKERDFNYVIFDDNDVTIEAKFSLKDNSTPTLDSMGLQQIYERLAGTKLVKDAMADLKRLGMHVYAQGGTTWKSWFQGMKDSLGKLFRRFRPTMEKLYATTKSDVRYSVNNKGGKDADSSGVTRREGLRSNERQGNASARPHSRGLSQYADSEPESHAERVRRLTETSPAGLGGKPVALPANRPGGEADDGQRVSDSRYSLRTDRTGDPRVDAVLDKIGSPDKTLADRIKDSLGNLAHKETRMREIEQGFFDRYASLRYLDKMAGITGPDDSAYISARMSTSFSDVMYAMVHHGHPIWKDGGSAVSGKGLMEIFKPVADELDVFMGWMVGARAQKLMNEGRERYFDQDEINILKGLKTPENSARWEKVRRDYLQYKKQVLDFAEQAGVINPEARRIWDHEEYVPFYRVVEDKPKGPFKVKGLASQNSGIRTLKGADERLGDIFENIIRNFSHLTDAAIKNRATELAVQKAEQIGAATPAPLEWKAVKIGNQQVVDAVHEFFGETQDDVDAFVNPEEMEAFTTFFHPAKPMGKDVLHVLRDGKPQYYQVHDDLLLRSMTSINEQVWGGPAMTAMRAVKRLLTIGVTSAPDFMIRNFVRDTLHTWTISRGDFVPVVSSLTGAVKAFRQDDDMVQLMAAGGAFHGGFAYGNDPAAVKLMVKKLITKRGIDKRTILDSPRKLWEFWQEFGSAMENAARVRTYANVKAKTGSHLQAAFEAKDIMDFSMRGDWAAINFLTQTVPFLGARIQGLQRLGKGMRENPVAFTLKGSVIALASTLLWLHNSMRPEYQELEEWDKDTYFHFFVGKKHFRLPKPFEVGAIFGTMPERLLELTLDKQHDGKLFAERMLSILTQTFAVGLPQILSEPMQQWANKDFFTGREIVGRDLQRMMPGEQSTPYTSVTAKGLGRAVNVSPKRIEHAVKGYLGTLGLYCMGASDTVVRKLWDYPAKPASRREDWPVLSAFYRGEGPARNTKYATEFYALLRETDQLTDTIQRLRETGEIPRADKLIEKNLPKLAVGGMLGQVQSELSQINKQMKRIHLDRSMSPDEKRAQLDELQGIKNGITRTAMEQAKDERNQ